MKQWKTPTGKRARVLIEPSDEERLLSALDRWAESGRLVPLRTRAFVLLLWDGSFRTSRALALNVDDVVENPNARLPSVLRTITQRARQIVLSARAQDAIATYWGAVQSLDLPSPRPRSGPLFVAMHRACVQRLSQRSAIHHWEMFQLKHVTGCSRIYQLEDVVYSARLEFLDAAGGNVRLLSRHAGISHRWAAEYGSRCSLSSDEVIAKLDRSR